MKTATKLGMAHILTIDDDKNVRKLLVKGLSTLGHRVIEASNGKQGLTKAFCRRIDVILLDIGMPDMNGLEVLKRLKESPRTRHFPIVMLTGHDDPEFRDQAYFDYAEDYIVKTTPIRKIDEKIAAVLEAQEQRPAGWPTVLRW